MINLNKEDIKGNKILISSFSTEYPLSINEYNQNRIYNMQKTAEAISTIIKPNEEFNWFKIVGIANHKNGYKIAKIIESGKMILGYGGGICQVTTTLYQALLKTNLKILEKHSHSKSVEYIQKGKDATVSFPNKNFRFLNNTNNNIMIESTVKDGIVKVNIYKIINNI